MEETNIIRDKYNLPSLDGIISPIKKPNELNIFHSADIQVNCAGVWEFREFEYRYVLRNMVIDCIKSGSKTAVFTGDIFERYITTDHEKQVFTDFIYDLLDHDIEVIITAGNHDLSQKSFLIDTGNGHTTTKIDAIEYVCNTIKHPKLHYLMRSGFYHFNLQGHDVVFANWSHKQLYSNYDTPYNPWEHTAQLANMVAQFPNAPFIDLYHNPIYDCKDWDGSVLRGKNEERVHPNEFKGDLALLGDIHCPEIGRNDKGSIWTYCSSPIIRSSGEGDYYKDSLLTSSRMPLHGYNMVTLTYQDTSNKPTIDVEFMKLEQYRALHTVDLTDINDTIIENFQLVNPSRFSNFVKIRPDFSNADNQELMSQFVNKIKVNYADTTVEVIPKKSGMLERPTGDSIINNVELENLFTRDVVSKICLEQAELYLKDMKVGEELKKSSFTKFSDILNSELDKIDFDITEHKAEILSVELNNYMTYEYAKVDFTKYEDDTTINISGTNKVGKTKLMSAITWAKTNQFSHKQIANRKAFLVNLFNDKCPELDECKVTLDFKTNRGEHYQIQRSLVKHWKRNPSKTVANWKNEISKVEQFFKMYKIDNEGIHSDVLPNDAEKIMNQYFGTYNEYTELHTIDSSTLSDLINMKTDHLTYWILTQLGSEFVIDLQGSNKDVKNTLLGDLTKPKIALHEAQHEISSAKEEISTINSEIGNLEFSVDEIMQANQHDINDRAALLAVTVTPLPSDLQGKTIEDIDNTHSQCITKISEINADINSIKESIAGAEKHNKDVEERIVTETNKRDLLIKTNTQLNTDIGNISTNSANITGEISQIISDKIDSLNAESKVFTDKILENNTIITEHSTTLNELNNQFIIDTNKKLTEKKSEPQAKVAELQNKVITLGNDRVSLNTKLEADCGQIERWEKLFNDNPSCPTCQQSMDSADSLKYAVSQKKEEVKDIRNKIDVISAEITDLNAQITDLKMDISKIDQLITELQMGQVTIKNVNGELKDKYISIENKIETIKANNATLLNDSQAIVDVINNIKISQSHDTINESISALKTRIELNDVDIKNNRDKISSNLLEINNCDSQVQLIRSEMINIDSLNLKISEHNNTLEKINNWVSDIDNKKKLITRFNEETITVNNLQPKIQEFNARITEQQAEINKLNRLITDNSTKITTLEHTIQQFESDIDNILEWEINNLTFKAYNKIVSGKVLQSFLFDKLISVLNDDLAELLEGINFKVGFDRDTHEFVFIDSVGVENVRPVYMISGMEETFSTLSLLAVIKSRKIRKNSNIIMIDEITGKLSDGDNNDKQSNQAYNFNYQELFIELLNKFKARAKSKVFIVDHILSREIYDYNIRVVKTEKGTGRIMEIGETETIDGVEYVQK